MVLDASALDLECFFERCADLCEVRSAMASIGSDGTVVCIIRGDGSIKSRV